MEKTHTIGAGTLKIDTDIITDHTVLDHHGIGTDITVHSIVLTGTHGDIARTTVDISAVGMETGITAGIQVGTIRSIMDTTVAGTVGMTRIIMEVTGEDIMDITIRTTTTIIISQSM